MSGVGDAYDELAEYEWARLELNAYHRLELLVTLHHLEQWLPERGLILDAGGGPGRYTIELCRRGHELVLLDLSEGNIRLAGEKLASEPPEVRSRLRESSVGDVRDLSRFESGSFDGVLCLGPLTHLPSSEDRRRAVSELVRVARPGAPVAISVGGYLAMLRTVMDRFSEELVDAERSALLSEGDNQVRGMRWHFFRAEEVRALAEEGGLTTLTMAGCQGLSTGLEEATNRLAEDEARWARWLELLLASSTESALVDLAEHILYIGRAPA